jgi:peptidoglycan/LPS O-acetylase OafA/YrhL
MIDAWAASAGLGYFAAIAAVFVAALIAKAGAPRSPNEEPVRRGFVMAALAFAAALTPGVLMLYGYAAGEDAGQRLALMILPIAAGFLGSLLGALLGLVTRDARAMFRMASIVAGFGALILALGVTLPVLDPTWLVSAAEAFTQ